MVWITKPSFFANTPLKLSIGNTVDLLIILPISIYSEIERPGFLKAILKRLIVLEDHVLYLGQGIINKRPLRLHILNRLLYT